VSGVVTEVKVKDNQTVRRATVLYIDKDRYKSHEAGGRGPRQPQGFPEQAAA